MTDEERAERLARAIDDLIQSIESPDTSHGLDDEELDALLRVAQDRLEAGRARQDKGERYESEVWERLQDRLTAQTRPTRHIDLPREQHDALRDIISLRMQMANDIFNIAESHKDVVWERVQFRLRQSAPRPHEIPTETGPETDIESMTRRSLGRLAQLASDPVQNRFRERLKRDAQFAAGKHLSHASHSNLKLTLGVVAGVLVAAAIVGPLPITGLEGHPVVQLAEEVANQAGVVGAEEASASR
jgi:hypothetical protein